MKLKGLDFLDKAFLNMDLSVKEQEKLDNLLYGAPYTHDPMPPKPKRRLIIKHLHRYGLGKECPVCKVTHTIPK